MEEFKKNQPESFVPASPETIRELSELVKFLALTPDTEEGGWGGTFKLNDGREVVLAQLKEGGVSVEILDGNNSTTFDLSHDGIFAKTTGILKPSERPTEEETREVIDLLKTLKKEE